MRTCALSQGSNSLPRTSPPLQFVASLETFAVLICVETLEALMSMVVNIPIVVSSSELGSKEKMDQLNAISFRLQFFFQSDCRSLKARILSLAQDSPYNSWHLWREICSCDLR